MFEDDLVAEGLELSDVPRWASASGQIPRILALAAANSSSVSTPWVCSAARFWSCAVASSSGAGASCASCSLLRVLLLVLLVLLLVLLVVLGGLTTLHAAVHGGGGSRDDGRAGCHT